ncbi:MAG: HPF/RaiA family ribosome-associated protein [Rhizobiales bacterium]|nr:HPF/RaiA family ribosome-associated protein [Hyphomicrobiales bacterium]
MQLQAEISFQGIEPSDFVRQRIEKELTKLERFHDRITHCRVVLSSPGKHHKKGGLFAVHLHLTIPGHKEIAVSREPQKHQAHEDPYVAVRDAFNAARRMLQDIEQKMAEATVVPHNVEQLGKIARLIAEEDYGFIEAPGTLDVYFHRNEVAGGDFNNLEVGTPVRFISEDSEGGPKATFVRMGRD